MKIFISWSGERSHHVAEALRNWLPHVIQGLQPWLSSNDIDKGVRWAADMASHLEDSRVGIICLSPDNLDAAWILFEAGALSKTINQTFVCPYLIDLEPTDVKGPLAQFQASKSDKNDTRKLIKTINRAQEKNALAEDLVNAAFQKWWPDLEKKLIDLPPSKVGKAFERSEKDMLKELLTFARHFEQRERTTAGDTNKIVQAVNDLTRQLRSLGR